MKGQGFLKVTGILMIIGGSINLIIAILAALGVAVLAAMDYDLGILYFSCVVLILSAVAQFVSGILGVVNCKKPEKAQVCLVFGIIVIILCVIGNILNVVGGDSISVFSLLLGLALPVLYVIGAVMNKKSING